MSVLGHSMKVWGLKIPVWVSRKTAKGEIATFTVPLWMFMLLGLLAISNALAWGFLGLYFAAKAVGA